MWRWWTFGIALLILTGGFVLIQGFHPAKGTEKIVTIPEGASRLAVAGDLKKNHLIRSRIDFLLLLVLERKVMKAGTYNINPNDSLSVIVNILSQGQERYATLTIPEGWRKEQIGQELTKLGYDGEAFVLLAENKEGALFPDTYFLPLHATPADIVAKFDQNYTQKTADLGITKDQLILASIVEREGKNEEDKPLIAQIYLNRLKQGMRLEADPTVQYGRDNLLVTQGKTVTFWQPITVADYSRVQSPYNTYLHAGLPPGPITNPGLKSIEAVIHPTATTALYFFHTKEGTLITSQTLAEHNTNKKKYL